MCVWMKALVEPQYHCVGNFAVSSNAVSLRAK